jgi:hypothetical protein
MLIITSNDIFVNLLFSLSSLPSGEALSPWEDQSSEKMGASCYSPKVNEKEPFFKSGVMPYDHASSRAGWRWGRNRRDASPTTLDV